MIWQPIATAPKSVSRPAPGGGHLVSGVYLRGFCPEEGADPAGCIEIIWWEPHEGRSGHWVTGISRCNPTHWMLLPTPPESNAADGAPSRHTGQLRDEQNPSLNEESQTNGS